MCRAPAATCWRISSSTTSRSTTRNAPLYTGTIGQCRQRCLHPRVASVEPATRCSPSGITTLAYFAGSSMPARSGTRNFCRASEITGSVLFLRSGVHSRPRDASALQGSQDPLQIRRRGWCPRRGRADNLRSQAHTGRKNKDARAHSFRGFSEEACRKPRSRVHGHIKANQIGLHHEAFR